MRAKLIKYVTCVTLVLVSMVCAVSADMPLKIIALELIPVEFEDVLEGVKSGNVDSVLYPSGMTLPTKYADIFFFASSQELEYGVPEQLKGFLTSNWPTADGRYTMAEVKTAELFYYLYCWPTYSTVTDDPVLDALDGDIQYILNFDSDTKAARLDMRNSNLIELLERYSSALKAPSGENDSPVYDLAYPGMVTDANPARVPLGLEYNTYLPSYLFPDGRQVSDTLNEIARFLDTRQQYWDYIGVQFFDIGVNLVDVEHLAAYNGYTMAIVEDELVSAEELPLYPSKFLNLDSKYIMSSDSALQTPQRVEEPQKSNGPVSFSTEIVESELPSLSSAGEPNRYVSSFQNGITSDDLPERRYGIVDVLTISSIVLVLTAVIAVCVIDYIRKRNDPSRRWRS